MLGGAGGGHSCLILCVPTPQYGSEVEELQQHLTVAKEVQQQLRTEVSAGRDQLWVPWFWGGPAVPELCPCPQLQDLQEKYAECGGMLQEAQEEVKSLRSRSLPNSTVSRYAAPSLLPVVSGGVRGGLGGALLPPSAYTWSPVSPGLTGS